MQWFSKKRPTGETTVFGAKFVFMKQGIDALKVSKHKLRMMGILISAPSYIYGDNMSAVHNTSRPESVQEKKSIQFYHTVHEFIAMDESLIGHATSKENIADLMTYALFEQKMMYLASNILFRINDKYKLSVE